MYIIKKNVLCLYIKYIYIGYKLYQHKYINVNKCCICVHLSIPNKYTQYKHICNFYQLLEVINRLKALVHEYVSCEQHWFNVFIQEIE